MTRPDKQVPYDRIETAKRNAEQLFPDADRYAPEWNNGRVYIEVWEAGAAKLYREEDLAAAVEEAAR